MPIKKFFTIIFSVAMGEDGVGWITIDLKSKKGGFDWYNGFKINAITSIIVFFLFFKNNFSNI